MRTRSVVLHLANVLPPALWLARADGLGRWPAAIALFFGVFALFHDVMHGALRLPRGLNEALLTVLGWLVGVGGHSTRIAHLGHHAHPFSEEDLEGRDARGSVWNALFSGPSAFAALPGWALGRTKPSRRPWLVLEWLGVAAILGMLLATSPGRAYVAVVAALQLTIPVWGARLPHAPPAWMVALALPFARFHWVLPLSLVIHEAHHAEPRRTTFELLADQRSKTSGRVTREALG